MNIEVRDDILIRHERAAKTYKDNGNIKKRRPKQYRMKRKNKGKKLNKKYNKIRNLYKSNPKKIKVKNNKFVRKKGRRKHSKENNKQESQDSSMKRNSTNNYKCTGESLGNDCLSNIVLSSKYERDRITNFNNQKIRIAGFKRIADGKSGKNTNFENTTTYLLLALGGNVTNLNCSKKPSLTAEASTTYKTLANCSTSVIAECTLPNNTVNQTELEECKASFNKIQKKTKSCVNMNSNGTAICECWSEAVAMTAEAKIIDTKKCDAFTAQKKMKEVKTACIQTFRTCKQAEDASLGFIMKCSTDTEAGTAPSAKYTNKKGLHYI